MIAFIFIGKNYSSDYHLGVYEAFKKNKIIPDLIVGTKVGALNAVMISSNNIKKIKELWNDDSFREILNSNFNVVNNIDSKGSNSFTEIYKDIRNMNSYRAIVRNNVNVDLIKNSKIKCIISTLKLGNMKKDIYSLSEVNEYDIHDYISSSLLNDNDNVFNMVDLSAYNKVFIINSGEALVNKNPLFQEIKNVKYDLNSYYLVGYLDGLKYLSKLLGNDYYFELKKEKYFIKANKNITQNIYDRVSNILNTQSYQQTVIKACEYVLKSENSKIDTIYKFKNILKYVKKTNNNDIVYNYIKLLKL